MTSRSVAGLFILGFSIFIGSLADCSLAENEDIPPEPPYDSPSFPLPGTPVENPPPDTDEPLPPLPGGTDGEHSANLPNGIQIDENGNVIPPYVFGDNSWGPENVAPSDPWLDSDNDGYTDAEEAAMYTDPLNGADPSGYPE